MGTLEALDKAIDAARASDAAEALISGVMLVRTQLFRILQEEGLERVSVLGQPYDPRSSEVVQRRPVTDPDQDGVVIEELQGGHQLRGHIIRRAKVVVGELADDSVTQTVVMAPVLPAAKPAAAPAAKPAAREEAFEATAALPALADEDGATPTIAMGVHEIEAMVSRKNAAAAAAAAAKAKAAPAPPEPPAEEPIVVEDWAEPTQAGTPGTLVDAAVAAARASSASTWDRTQTDAPARGRRASAPPAPPPPPPPAVGDPDSGDESANATMVLADSAALFVRPGAPAPAGRAQAAPAAPAPAEAEEWEAADQWQGNDPNETQPVPREQRKPTAPPPPRGGAAPAATARPRVASPTDVPKRQARARPEEPPTTPSAPAFRPPPATPAAGTARRGPQGTGSGLYVGLALVFLLVAGGVGYGVWKVTHKPPVEITQNGPLPTTSTTIPEEVQVVRPTTPEEAANQTPPPGGVPPVTVSPPVNAVSTTLPAPVTLPPPTTQAAPPPTAVRAPPTTLAPVNPVATALAQADGAMTAHNYNEAIKHFDAALAAEPGNAEAAQGKLRAMGERAASLDRYWKTDPTMTEGKSSGGGLAGFDGATVVKVKCDCALTYEISPTKPVQGQPYTVKINLKNDTKKDIKLRSLLLTLRINNVGTPKTIPLLANQAERGKTVTVGQVDDTWKLGTTSWSLEGAVTDQGGVTYRAQYTWDVRQ